MLPPFLNGALAFAFFFLAVNAAQPFRFVGM